VRYSTISINSNVLALLTNNVRTAARETQNSKVTDEWCSVDLVCQYVTTSFGTMTRRLRSTSPTTRESDAEAGFKIQIVMKLGGVKERAF
jgi:3-phosphoglycerate kinase